jgi:hypothetical protein
VQLNNDRALSLSLQQLHLHEQLLLAITKEARRKIKDTGASCDGTTLFRLRSHWREGFSNKALAALPIGAQNFQSWSNTTFKPH